METNQLVSSISNVILTVHMRPALEQGYGQGCRRQTPGTSIFFSMQICYMVLILKHQGEWDLGLFIFPVLAKIMRVRGGNFWLENAIGREIRRNMALHSASLLTRTCKVHKPRSFSALHFEMKNIYQIRAGKINTSSRRLLPAALLENWPQVSCIKITCGLPHTVDGMPHPSCIGLAVQPWPPPHQVEISGLQVPHAYAEDESLWLAEL